MPSAAIQSSTIAQQHLLAYLTNVTLANRLFYYYSFTINRLPLIAVLAARSLECVKGMHMSASRWQMVEKFNDRLHCLDGTKTMADNIAEWRKNCLIKY